MSIRLAGHRRQLAVLISIVGAAGMVAAAPGAAMARTAAPLGSTSNKCYQSPSAANCDNTDPYDTDCSVGSYVANSVPVSWYDPENGKLTGGSSGYIQNWYSPHCGTNWARYVDTSGTAGQVDIVTCLNDEFVHCTDWYYSAVFPAWSNQLYAKTTVATAFADFASFAGGTASGSASA